MSDKEDAALYRWLRSHVRRTPVPMSPSVFLNFPSIGWNWKDDQTDAANIDAAVSLAREEEG